jgi:hypothetical protein
VPCIRGLLSRLPRRLKATSSSRPAGPLLLGVVDRVPLPSGSEFIESSGPRFAVDLRHLAARGSEFIEAPPRAFCGKRWAPVSSHGEFIEACAACTTSTCQPLSRHLAMASSSRHDRAARSQGRQERFRYIVVACSSRSARVRGRSGIRVLVSPPSRWRVHQGWPSFPVASAAGSHLATIAAASSSRRVHVATHHVADRVSPLIPLASSSRPVSRQPVRESGVSPPSG